MNLALVISDIMMPEMNGLELLAQIKLLYPLAPRIVLTGYADKENAIQALNELGLFYYVEKPWDDEIFRQLISNALQRYRQGRMESLFRRYVPFEIIESFVDQSDDAILEGKTLEATILFLDIVDFTRLAAHMEAQAMVKILNEYFTMMVEVVHRHQGILDKFTGDGLMALFGVPSATSNALHAQNALLAAREIVERISALNKKREADNLTPIRVRIGLDTGQVVAGNIGSSGRVNYTVIGDAVNTASRIEDAARHIIKNDPGCVLISQNLYQCLSDDTRNQFSFEAQGATALRGKDEKVALYKIAC
jgi:adenylate cyclase